MRRVRQSVGHEARSDARRVDRRRIPAEPVQELSHGCGFLLRERQGRVARRVGHGDREQTSMRVAASRRLGAVDERAKRGEAGDHLLGAEPVGFAAEELERDRVSAGTVVGADEQDVAGLDLGPHRLGERPVGSLSPVDEAGLIDRSRSGELERSDLVGEIRRQLLGSRLVRAAEVADRRVAVGRHAEDERRRSCGAKDQSGSAGPAPQRLLEPCDAIAEQRLGKLELGRSLGRPLRRKPAIEGRTAAEVEVDQACELDAPRRQRLLGHGIGEGSEHRGDRLVEGRAQAGIVEPLVARPRQQLDEVEERRLSLRRLGSGPHLRCVQEPARDGRVHQVVDLRERGLARAGGPFEAGGIRRAERSGGKEDRRPVFASQVELTGERDHVLDERGGGRGIGEVNGRRELERAESAEAVLTENRCRLDEGCSQVIWIREGSAPRTARGSADAQARQLSPEQLELGAGGFSRGGAVEKHHDLEQKLLELLAGLRIPGGELFHPAVLLLRLPVVEQRVERERPQRVCPRAQERPQLLLPGGLAVERLDRRQPVPGCVQEAAVRQPGEPALDGQPGERQRVGVGNEPPGGEAHSGEPRRQRRAELGGALMKERRGQAGHEDAVLGRALEQVLEGVDQAAGSGRVGQPGLEPGAVVLVELGEPELCLGRSGVDHSPVIAPAAPSVHHDLVPEREVALPVRVLVRMPPEPEAVAMLEPRDPVEADGVAGHLANEVGRQVGDDRRPADGAVIIATWGAATARPRSDRRRTSTCPSSADPR